MTHIVQDSLYPDILFHFTNRKALFDILRSTFKVSYAREFITGKNYDRKFAIPMISFCDLKLTELKNHMEKYGSYGIGLTKEWANRNGLNPVMYISRHCDLTDDFITGLNGIYNHLDKLNNTDKFEGLSRSYTNILSVYQYLKNYEGPLVRGEKLINKNYRFADEREWRYVPNLRDTGGQPFIPISKIDTHEKKMYYNQKIDHLSLNFQPDDIKYLIIEQDEEISDLIRHLKNVKQKFDKLTIERLSSRILTAEQIRRDI
ncbi:hypothetical protein IC229_04270 [Spirosoma sp. BT702]|uniref:Uncharacterized protein n=1 Tax=Spirosoma profusum TaxID=2771354 RepID=A0A927AQ76_9BACT|nr:abortive infection system antitoxin AbiGi family protein [Spirosoma profusum]MBD2699838.1 hypothetical protein [Spirosoma profusum]